MIISIDIGTSYSSICMSGPDGKARPVDIRTGAGMYGSDYSLPSAVFVEDDGKVLVGQAAMNNMKRKPQNFRMEFKRDIGQEIPIFLGNNKFLPEDFYTEIFRHMIECVGKISSESIEKVYLTCPAAFGKNKKDKIITAAKAAGLFQAELVDEPTAAAMNYCAEGFLKDNQKLMVYDFGGGTFDVSLIYYKDGMFQRLTEPHGLERCGGIDMDRLIFQDMLSSIDAGLLDRLDGIYRMRFESQLAELAVKAKHHLSAAEQFEEDIQFGFDMIPYELTVEKFNGMIAGLVGQTVTVCRDILKSANLQASELASVLMVGGTSRVPLVKEMMMQFAGNVPVFYSDDLELAVVKGALNFRAYRSKGDEDVNDKDAEQRKGSVEKGIADDVGEFPPTPVSEFKFRAVAGGYEVSAYQGESSIINIPSWYNGRPVVKIGNAVFCKCNFMKVKIPSSCRIIGAAAFYGDSNLSEVIFASDAQIEEIGKEAFSGCGLKRVRIPSSCHIIGERAFYDVRIYGDSSLSEVIFASDAQIEEIGKEAFSGCGLKKVKIPSSCRIIGEGAFLWDRSLSEVIFASEAQIEEIGKEAFSGCDLKKVKIPSSCRIIRESAFRCNMSLSEVIFASDAQIEEIGACAFSECDLKKINIPASCRIIRGSVFHCNRSLSEVIFASDAQIEEIGACAFSECDLKKVNIPASCRIIGALVFQSNFSLSEVIFASDAQIESLDERAFVDSNIHSIKLPANCKCDRLWRFGTLCGIFKPNGSITIERY